MAFAEYIARRRLAPGHVVGTVYGLQLTLVGADRSVAVLREQPEALDGSSETLYFGEKVSWQIRTIPYSEPIAGLVREFLASVSDGQVFLFDLYGNGAGSVQEISVTLDGAYSEARAVQYGSGGRDDRFRFSFAVRET